MSGVASTRPRIKPARASIRPERRSPPSAFGRASPCRRSNPRQRIALDALTPKRCAACLHESPPAIAASTRVLRSSDSAFDMSAGLRPADSLNHRCPDLGIAPSHSARITLKMPHAMVHGMSHETRALSYIELAKLFDMTVPSARNMVRKRCWSRTLSNDGKTVRVNVPLDALPPPPTKPADAAPGDAQRLRGELDELARISHR